MATISHTDVIYSQAALQAFTQSLVPFSAFSRSYTGDAAQVGQAIRVPLVETLSATTFSYTANSGFPYEDSGGAISAVTITMDKHLIVTVDVTDVQAANTSSAAVENFGHQQGKALGRKVQELVWSVVTPTNFGAAVTAAPIANISKAAVNAARTALVKRGVPTDSLALICNSDVYQNLLDDSTIAHAMAYGSPEAIRDGRVPRLLGMDVYEASLFPLNSASLVGMVVHRDALALAVRPLQPQEASAYQAVEILVDSDTGLACTYRRHYSPGRGRYYASLETIVGYTPALTLGAALIARTN